jgi:hypothetical protein
MAAKHAIPQQPPHSGHGDARKGRFMSSETLGTRGDEGNFSEARHEYKNIS